MTPDVRERASEAVDAVMNTVTHDYGEMLFAVVDAVAEVLAAADAQRNAQLTAEVEVAHAYRAEWGTLRAQLESAEECYVEASAVAARRGQERDTLKARVAEQEIAFAEKLAGVTDASTRHVKQLSERVDLLTAALTELVDVYHVRPLNELLDQEETVSEDDEPKFAAWVNALEALSAAPIKSETP